MTRTIRYVLFVAALVPAAGRAQARHEIIRGRVTGDSARAVRGADVIATRTSDRIAKVATTGVDGRYAIDWPDGSGDYALSVSAPGFQTASIHLVRAGADSVLVADVRLAPIPRLNAVVSSATRPVPDRDPASYGAGGSESSTFPVNAARRLPPDQAGDLNAIAAMLPGVSAVNGGISVAGLPANQNSVTLNGLAFAGADVPRDASTRLRVITSSYDPSNGWFSGAQTAVDLAIGNQFTQRTTHWTVDAPPLQYGDRISAQSGQRFTNVNAGFGGNGQLFGDSWAYNFGLQGGRKASDVASLVTADQDLLQHAGVAPDSAVRLLAALRQIGVPSNTAGAPSQMIDQNVSFIGRIDHAPYDWNTRAYNPTTYGAQAYVKLGDVKGQGTSPVATPAHAGTSSTSIASLTGFFTRVFGRSYLADVRSGVTLTRNANDPLLALPDGRAMVLSSLPGGNGVSTLQFGGNSGLHTDTRSARWETNAQLQLYPPGYASHRVKLAADARYDEFAQDIFANELGTFSYNSLGDVAGNRPASFTRTLTSPTRRGGEWNAFVSAGDLWRASPSLQVIYGVRADANVFTTRPALNQDVLNRFGVRTSAAPNSIDLSPRLGFTWQKTARTTIRGGVGEFRNIVDASLLGVPSVSTGLPGTTLRLSCVGAAVPVPDWASYVDDPGSIPRTCAGGAGPLADAAPGVQLVDPAYRPQRSWRSNLGIGSSIGKSPFSVDAILSYNLDQPGTVDANFVARPQFTLSDEGRPVYVASSSIVPASGALAPTTARIDTTYGRVVRMVSDLTSVSEQGVFTFRPFIPDAVRRWAGDINVSYTLTHARAEQRGFDGAALGDPSLREWGRGDLDARHQFVVQGALRPMGNTRAILFVYGRVQSGLPFTPLVSGDVNGDGLANDRAYIADSPGLRSLIASSTSPVATCLTSQIGRIAGRNSCEGPWTAQLNASLRLDRSLLHNQRADVTINLGNPLGGLDQLMHGNNLRGWGSPAVPDRTLYIVRGFDPARNRFIYDVNQRFGSTSAAATTIRAPFRLTVDVSVDIAPSIPDQMLDRWLRPGRAGHAGKRITSDELVRRLQTTVPDPFSEVLQQTDSLLLTDAQVKQLQAIDAHYRAHGEYSRTEVQQQLAQILSPIQTATLSGWAGQMFRSHDRMRVRLAPRGG